MTKKRKKGKFTAKNTHVSRGAKKKELQDRKIPIGARVAAIIFIAIGLLLIIIKACDNRVPGYDHWLGMPWIWV